MLRLFLFIVALAVLVAGSVWLADRPGAVTIDWLGWRVETDVPILVLAVVVMAAVVVLGWRLAVWVLWAPARISLRGREVRQRRGYQALVDGLAAAAAGHGKEARRLAARADRMLDDPALTAFLSAQAAHLTGDAQRAHEHYTAMIARPETESAGLRGLLREALDQGDATAAIDLANRARKLAPADPSLADTLFGLLLRAGRLDEAEDLVDDAARRRAMTAAVAKRRGALISHERATRAASAGDANAALDHARRAVAADPTFAAAAATLARLYAAAGRDNRADSVLVEAWKRQPAPELLAAALALHAGEDALGRLRRLEKMTAGNAEHAETHLALAEAALEARLWGEARRHLQAAVAKQPSPRAFRLFARLEQEEFHNDEAARNWLARMATAGADAGWRCSSCGGVAASWTVACPSCGAIDSLHWTTPAASVPAPPASVAPG